LADVVTELCDALSWRTQAFGERVARRAVEIVANDLPAVIDLVAEKTGARARADAVLVQLHALPAQSYVRILVAPETSRRLYAAHKDPSPTFFDLVDSWCLAERLRLGDSIRLEEITWTALGDAWWTPGDAPRAHQAIRLVDRIVADFDSPWTYRSASSVPDPREDWQEGAPFTVDERGSLSNAFSVALHRVGAASLEAQALIINLTRSLVVLSRIDPGRPFSSQSQRAVPGRTTLIFHRSFARDARLERNIAVIADALIHEAIHSGIYWLEIDEPLFFGDGPNGSLRLCSPWTGRALPPQTFVHACFVWAGLKQFWSRPATSLIFGEAETEHHLTRATADPAAIRATLEPIWNELNPTIRCALENTSTGLG
jgi:hypothetical protein